MVLFIDLRSSSCLFGMLDELGGVIEWNNFARKWNYTYIGNWRVPILDYRALGEWGECGIIPKFPLGIAYEIGVQLNRFRIDSDSG